MTIAVILLILAIILAIVALFSPPHAWRLTAGACVAGFLGVLLMTGSIQVA